MRDGHRRRSGPDREIADGPRSGHRRKRKQRLTRRGRIVAWTGGVLATLLLVTAGVGAWVYQHLNGNIQAADVDGKIGGGRPVNHSPGSKTILVVGSDSRDGDNAAYGKGLTTMQSDTLMVVHIAANRKWATVASLPRDSWVEIPSCDRGEGSPSSAHHFKINEAFAIGGIDGDVAGAAACTIKTVEKNTGLRIDHFMSVDFQGFKGMVNALGGIEVCPKEDIHDTKAQLDLEAGCQTVKGEKALGYVRTRYSVGDGSDLGRIQRQQEFLRSLAEKARKKLTNPKALYGFLNSATKSLTTDKDLAGIKPLYKLASAVKDIPEDRLAFVTVPNYPREADVPTDKANVVWQYPQAADLFTAMAKDKEMKKKEVDAAAKDLITAHQVRVRVLNGTGEQGRAAKVSKELRTAGFTVVSTGNATSSVETSTVTCPEDQRRHATVLASRLTGERPKVSTDSDTDVVTLTVGSDFEGVR